MFSHLQIDDPRERSIVGVVDGLLDIWVLAARLAMSRTRPVSPPRRILLLRLERVGDLIMTLDAIAAVRRLAPQAELHLAVGSWNEGLARLIPGIDHLETLDAAWLAREAGGQSASALLERARRWRAQHVDLAINFEGDLRTNLLMRISGAPRRVGFGMAGGRAFLTDHVTHDPRTHTSVNSLRLVERAFGRDDLTAAIQGAPQRPRLALPGAARGRASELLGEPARLVGVHAGGGRLVKLWDPRRFADVATRLVRSHDATIVLTGSAPDRAVVDDLRAALDPGATVIDLVDRVDLVTLAAVLQRLDLFITGDTGPMHIAAELETPVVAIFGPSAPARYAPRGERTRVLRTNLACSPCNRIRQPPKRCIGHIPDCLSGVEATAVYDAAVRLLECGALGTHGRPDAPNQIAT